MSVRIGWRARAALVLGMLPVRALAASAQLRVTGQVETEIRAFEHAPQFPGQHTHMASTSYASTAEISLARGQTLTVSPFLRVISDRPGAEPVVYFRSLAWSLGFDGWRLSAGIQTVRWGSSRLSSPVDVVNQLDRSFHPFATARIGQPMLRVSTERRWGGFELLLMSRVEPRSYPRRAGRLRGSAWVDPALTEYAPGGGGPVEVAGRWSTKVAEVELGLSGLVGTSRDPKYRRTESEPPTQVSIYESFRQAGIDARLEVGAWRFRAESALRRVGASAPYLVTITGVDRTLEARLFSLALTAEYVLDSRGRRSTSKSEDDLYLEAKARTRSARPLEASARLLLDRGDGSAVWTLSIWRPVAERWIVRVGTWQFRGADFASLARDGYLSASVRYSF